ncbi:MAG: hypothetical protein R3C11_17115 [Planctomycetaceae bacterium]
MADRGEPSRQYRHRTGTRLEWDAEATKAENIDKADQFIAREYREGWTLS